MSEKKHRHDADARLVLSRAIPEKDWNDQHLKDTPRRWFDTLQELTTPPEFDFTIFDSKVDEMIVEHDIPFYTFCAHHLLPFFGKAHVAYVPSGKICGLSKLARTVDAFCHDLNVQEELTVTIAEYLDKELAPKGVGVVMQAEHLCMTMRGIRVPGTLTTTSAMKGCFRDPTEDARIEFLQLIGVN